MALNPVKIFYSDGKILFEADKRTIEPKFTGTLLASLVETNRIKIERTDRQRPDGSNRVVFRRMKAGRVQNVSAESLVDTLGYTPQQVVDYLNNEFNRSNVDELNQSTFVEYDIYANVEYAGLFGVSDGSALRPYPTIQTAVDAAEDGDNIFLKGDFHLTTEVLLPADKSLHFFGRDTTQWCYAAYDPTNGKLVHQSSSTSTAKYSFHDIRFINAGDYAMYIRSAAEVTVRDCEFLRNGWSGNGLSCTDNATGSTLGFDSPQADLQAFWAGSETSNGGAMRIRSTPVVNITDNTVHSNLRGLRIQDCGIGGAGIIARNRTYNNIESGIYLAAGSYSATDGCENFTVYNNFSSNNSNNGILVFGGSNNIISLNRVEGNWNAGIMLWHVSDTRARDMDLDNNNRSEFNGIGNVGDAKASIQIDGQYMRSDATFLAEVLDTTVHNTGLGSSTTTNGLLIGSDVGTISGAVVNIDDVGFVSQDYAINLSEVDVSNITLALGDCRYQDIAQKAVLAPTAGNYNELPFSNHVTSALQVDVVLDTLRQMVSLTEGVGGNVINTYKMNELQSVINGSSVDLIQKQTDKIQLRGCTLNNTFVNGVVAGNTVASMNNTLNAAFTMDLTQYKEYLVSTVGVDGDDSTWYFIESPDGTFIYPLYETLAEATATDTVEGGSGTAQGYSFPDEPTGTTWYGPDTSFISNGTSAPSNGVYGNSTNVLWNEIATDADSTAAPTPFSDTSVQLDEASALNLQIHPSGATFTTTIQSPPAWITQATNNANITGTAPQILGDNTSFPSVDHTLTVVRTNSYGSSTGTLTITVNNLTTPASLPGTLHAGSVVDSSATNSAGRIYLQVTGGHVVYDLPTALADGDKLEWYHQDGSYIFGIAAAGVDKTTDLADHDADNSAKWDLAAPITGSPTNANGQNFGNNFSTIHIGMVPLGWDDNTNPQVIPTRPVYASSDLWKLYNNAGTIELSLNGVLFRSSSSTHTDPVITFGVSGISGSGGAVIYTEMPTFVHTADQATAPTGFTLDHGSMDTSSLINGDSTVILDNLTLSPGQRLVVNKSWIDTNVLPYIDGASGEDNKVYIGAPKPASLGGALDINDFWATLRVENQTSNLVKYTKHYTGPASQTENINRFSDTDSNLHFGIEFTREGDIVTMWSPDTDPSLTTEPITGTIGHVQTWSNADATIGSSALDLAVSTKGSETRASLSESGLSVITAPSKANEFDVTENASNEPLFNGSAGTTLTLAAGTTYKFWMHSDTIESTDTLAICLVSDNSTYTTGVTTVGTPGTFGAYLEFAVPADVPPVKFKWTSGGVAYYSTPSISGSTYVAPVTGISLEGPTANQTGTNMADNGDYGWTSIDETLSAGERFVMNNAFFTDLLAEMGDQYEIRIGLKGSNWDNGDQSTNSNSTVTGDVFKDDLQLRIYRSSSNNIYLQIFHSGVGGSSQMLINTTALHATVCAFIEVSSDGNEIRMGFGRNGYLSITQGDESTVAWSNWSSYKGTTGAQGFGITSLDVMFLVTDVSNGNNDDYDGANVDWTHLSEVSVPVPPATNATDWDKALDFSGGNEHAKQALAHSTTSPLRMNDYATNIAAPTTAGNTAYGSSVRPWATAVMFQHDGNSSNQHIWNQGEGTGSTDDNIYLRMDSTGKLYFGWGRSGALNECHIGSLGTTTNTSHWHGVYIAHTGERLSGSNATAANLADCFDIRRMGSNDAPAFSTISANKSTAANWTAGSTGGRMDRSYTGDFTIGGRGSNRNFHGKIASMVVTTLRIGQQMPTTTEVEKLLTDPVGWLTDYKVGSPFRRTDEAATSTVNFALGLDACARSTFVWLMGEGTNDSYPTIRNLVKPNDPNYISLSMQSMVSSDIETVTISGLT